MSVGQSPVDVAVVVVSYNSADVLPGLLDSLAPAMEELTWQLVVADNASADDSVAVVSARCPEAAVVQTGRNAGYAAGLNAGVAAAPPHRAVLVLNPDVRLERGCVRTLLASLGPETGIAVPRLVDGDGELHFSLRREPTVLRALGDALLGATRAGRWARLGELVTTPSSYLESHVVDWAEGSTQLVSAECWEACGGWDESYFLYSEETEFGLRAGQLGFSTLYVAQAHAMHLQGDSTTSPALWALLVANKVRLHRRRRGQVAGALFWLVMMLRESSRAALGRRTSRAALDLLTSPTRMRERPGPHTLVPR